MNIHEYSWYSAILHACTYIINFETVPTTKIFQEKYKTEFLQVLFYFLTIMNLNLSS